jgi:hypothetical protein
MLEPDLRGGRFTIFRLAQVDDPVAQAFFLSSTPAFFLSFCHPLRLSFVIPEGDLRFSRCWAATQITLLRI